MRTATRNVNKKLIHDKQLLILSLPAMIYIFIFNYIPMYGIILAFKNFDLRKGILGSKWVWFENFRFLFMSGDAAFRITRNTILLNILFIISGTIMGVLFAILLFELSRRLVKIYQTILFIPFFVSWVVGSYLLLGLLDYQGFVNNIIVQFGGERILWYNDPAYWPVILMLASIWKGIGYSCIIYYTGLLGIDPEYYDAAKMDGASWLQRVKNITLPLLTPLISLLLIMSIGGIIRADFGMFFQLTRDSKMLYPVTDVIDTFVYRSLMKMGDYGMSSAASLYQSVVGFIMILLGNFIAKKINEDYSLF